ncbi:MAG: PBPRA1643 family SWIM/SEC-C metal-binding motif protein [Pseudomonadales bacterium]
MSKLFFRGRLDKRESHANSGYMDKGTQKPGTHKYPLQLTVTSEQRKTEIEAILEENQLFANIDLNSEPEAQENIAELTGILNKPQTVSTDKTPNRNEPCSCGSGKKYKKCCG